MSQGPKILWGAIFRQKEGCDRARTTHNLISIPLAALEPSAFSCIWRSCENQTYLSISCGFGSVTYLHRYICYSTQNIIPLGHVLDIQKRYFAWKCPENTDYLIPNVFENSSLSLIAHEFAEHIYLLFVQIDAKLTEIFTILWKHSKTRNFHPCLRFRH